jgi:hypothetical protein
LEAGETTEVEVARLERDEQAGPPSGFISRRQSS